MTHLTKPVSRVSTRSYAGKPIVITLAPCGAHNEALIQFRLKGTRTRYVLRVSDCFVIAAQEFALAEKAAKKKARQSGVPWRIARKHFLSVRIVD